VTPPLRLVLSIQIEADPFRLPAIQPFGAN
jgi:hypothetical protein